MRDSNPGKEVAIWMRATYAYLTFIHKNPTANKSAVFGAVFKLMNGRDDGIQPRFVAKQLKRLMENPPRVLADVKNFTEDGRLKTGEKYLQ